MLCVKSRPKCEACPLQGMCSSYLHHSQAEYPQKKPKRSKPHRHTVMLLHRLGDEILLWRRPASGIWGGLWSLPEVDEVAAIELWQQSFLSQAQAPASVQANVIRHQFSHYSLDISVAVIELQALPPSISDADNYRWVATDQLAQHGLPTPVRKILSMLQTN